jgi:site-specific DNA recombinase
MAESEKKMRAVIYARYSSDMQTEDSISAQLRACSVFADSHNYIVVGEYFDRATSGKTDRRPEFQRMIADSKKDMFDIVLVHKYDRFARDRYDHAIYGKLLKDKGIALVAVAEYFGEGKESILMEGILQSLSEYYLANLSAEVKKGLQEIAIKGLFTGGVAPFGYDIAEQKYVINPVEAAFVHKMYTACANGTGYTEIVEELDKAGIKGKRGKPIKYTQIYEILRNEKYTGVYIYCINEHKDRNKRRSKEGAFRIEDGIPQIIDKDLWERVQKVLQSNKNLGKKAKREYLLSGLVVCGECGSKLHAQTTLKKGHEYSWFRCPNCKSSIKEKEANNIVFEYIKMVLSPESKKALADALTEYDLQMNRFEANTDAAINRQITEKQTQMDNLICNMSKGILSDDLLSHIDKSINELKVQIELLQKERSKPKKLDENLIISYLDFIADVTLHNPETQRMIINHLIKSVTITKTSVDVHSTFSEVLGKIGCGGQI